MPNLFAHFQLAMKIGTHLNEICNENGLGSLILGSASPDIRSMTKWPRDRTHFAPLTINCVGKGVATMFKKHPSLSDKTNISKTTKAFLAGYISHLIADDLWILGIYRPYFDNAPTVDQQIRANVLDRAIQLDMDRHAQETLDVPGKINPLLKGANEKVTINFIDKDSLRKWAKWLDEFTKTKSTWDRLRFATARMYRNTSHFDQAMLEAESFLNSLPNSLEEVYSFVPKSAITNFRKNVSVHSLNLIKRYLYVS